MIPKKAKEHLKSGACEIILSVGTDEMKKRRIDAIFQFAFAKLLFYFEWKECIKTVLSTKNRQIWTQHKAYIYEKNINNYVVQQHAKKYMWLENIDITTLQYDSFHAD